MKRKQKKQGGFTVVEVLITIAVTVVFIQAFYTLFNTVVISNAAAVQQANASAYAYWYIRAWTSEKATIGRACYSVTAANTSDPNYANRNDLTVDPSAPGYVFTTLSGSNGTFPLPGTVTLTGRLYRPAGCTDDNAKPIKLEATVTYGTGGTQKVTHAVYIP